MESNTIKSPGTASKVECFECLDPWFEKFHPQEARLVYDKMFQALSHEHPKKLEKLVFRTYQST